MAGPGYRVDPRPTDVIQGVALGKLLSEREIFGDQFGSVTWQRSKEQDNHAEQPHFAASGCLEKGWRSIATLPEASNLSRLLAASAESMGGTPAAW
jgi:hypothetical protein